MTLCVFLATISLIWRKRLRNKLLPKRIILPSQASAAPFRLSHDGPRDSSGDPLGPHDQKVYDALTDGIIRLLKCSWLASRPVGFVLDRRQELPPDAFFSPEEAASIFQRQKRGVCVLSYGWLNALHCDPHGLHAQRVIGFLRSPLGLHFEALFWDYGSLTQKGTDGSSRSEADQVMFDKALKVMAGLYASAHGTTVLRLAEIPPSPDPNFKYNSTPYSTRGWPKLECSAAMIMVGTEAQANLNSSVNRVPKMVDAISMQPILTQRPSTPEEFEIELHAATFVGRGDRQLVNDLYLSFFLSVGVRERARYKLDEVHIAAQQRRQRLRHNAVGVGAAMGTAMLLLWLVLFLMVPAPDNEYAHLCAPFIIVAVVVFGLAILPSDGHLIRRVSRWVAFVSFALALCSCAVLVLGLPAQLNELLLVFGVVVVFAFLGSLASFSAVQREKAVSQVDDQIKKAWLLLRFLFVCLSILLLQGCMPIFQGMSADEMLLHGTSLPSQVSLVARGTAILALAVLLRSDVRRVLQAMLANVGSRVSAEESKYAALAALFSSLGQNGALERAQKQFRLIPFDAIQSADELPGSGEGAVRSLRAQAIHADLGAENSFFVSHSWHDPREAKWDALCMWATSRFAEFGVYPLLWLDAGCISQDNVDASLALLPIFTGLGCQHFVMLAGPTYTTRLWTVIELFCFLRMGGLPSRAVLVHCAVHAGTPQEQGNVEANIRRQFEVFDVRSAQCAKKEDTQKLLACIETGFGSHTAFNQMVRQILKGTRVAQTSSAGPGAVPAPVADPPARKPQQPFSGLSRVKPL